MRQILADLRFLIVEMNLRYVAVDLDTAQAWPGKASLRAYPRLPRNLNGRLLGTDIEEDGETV